MISCVYALFGALVFPILLWFLLAVIARILES